MVTYSIDTAMSQYDYGTTATYQCDSRYELTGGDTVRTCTGDGSSPVGQWIGTAPNCSGSHVHATRVCMQVQATSPSVMTFSPQLSPAAPLPPLTKDFLEHLLGQHLEEWSHTAVTLGLCCLEIPLWSVLHQPTGVLYHSALVS